MNTILWKTGLVIGLALGMLVLTLALLGTLGMQEVEATGPYQLHSESIDTRLRLVDLQYHDVTGTLTLDVETRVTDGLTHTIIGFQNAFELDQTFTEHVIDVALSNQRFVSPTYLVSEIFATALDGSLSQLRYIYTLDHGTAVTLSDSEWSPVLRATITFTQVRATGAITWSPDSRPPAYLVLDETTTDISGGEIAPDASLQEIPLAPAIFDTRLRFVDLTYHGIETGTLTLDLQARGWVSDPVNIRAFQDGFWLDSSFHTSFITATFTDQFFPPSSYVTAEDTHVISTSITGPGVWFVLIYQNYGGPASVINESEWFTVVRTTIVYTQIQAAGNVTWTSLPPVFTVFDLSGNQLQGHEESIPPELQNLPLSGVQHIYLPLVVK